MSDPIDFSAWVKGHRSMAEAARKIGCSRSALCNVLKRRRRPGADLARKIEKVSGVPMQALYAYFDAQ